MADFPIAAEPIQPLGLAGPVLQPVPEISTRQIDPLAREKVPLQDEWSGFADAPAQDFSSFADAPDQFSSFKTADDLDVKSVDELDKDRDNFHPAEYFSSNPDVANDPKKLQKLLEVFRKRQEEGLTAKGVVQAAVKNTPGLVGDIAGGIKRLGERVIDVTAQPVVNVLGSLATGDIFDDQKRKAFFNEAKKSIKKGTAEVGSGSEAATVGLVDLARTGSRKVSNAYTPVPFSAMGDVGSQEPIPLKKPLSDQELLAQLSDDASFRQTADAAMRGEGEAAKNFGLDKETLAKQGIELDEKAIQQLSLVDPITMIATGGAFKLVGAGGKLLGAARTLEGAQQLADKLAKVAKFSTGKAIQGTGKVATFVGEKLQGSGRSASLITGVGSAMRGGSAIESLAVAAATKAAGPAVRKAGGLLEHAGKAIAGEVPVSANLQKVLDYAVKPAGNAAGTVIKGGLEGLVAGSPFALAAQDDETAGALLGAGAALGAAGGAGAGAFRVVKSSASRRYFGENRPVLPDVPSQAYGFDAALDAQHEANIQKLSAQDASELNNFREALRQQGGEIYAVDAPTFRQKMTEIFPGITPEQLDTYANHSAFFDQNLGDRKVVYLNSDTTGLQHDAGHIFDAILSPEKRAELRTAVESAFTPEQRKAFRDTYERKVGNKISDKAAVDEFIAEQFAALFNNVPVTELNAPKTLLDKFIDVAAEGAETLGIDLTAGTTTPNLGAPVNIGIRQLFRNAAGEVTRANIEGVPASPIKVDFGGNPPPPGAAPVPAPPKGPGPAPAPANVTPLPGARNIRVGPENVAAFKQSASPEVRAAADARARETGVDYARTEAKKAEGSPTSQVIERISDSMESGRPVVQIEHLGITSASTPETSLGRIPRKAERESGYAKLEAAQIDVRDNAPKEIVSQHSKNFVPVRWEEQNGKPILIAMSLDKVIANMMKVASDPKARDLIPYPVENGKFTTEGWREVVADAQAYAENQANGRKGDGGRLEVPEAGLSIPAENPAYTPQPLSTERANFQNLVQGIAPPLTAKKGSIGSGIQSNIKAQLLAEANRRPTETPARIEPKRVSKQAFLDFPGRTVQETNPLRNRLKEVGVDVDNLNVVTERIRAQDIKSAVARPEISYRAPVTDTIRGGFLPGPEKISQIKSTLAESEKTGALDFDTFISAFRDNYFSGFEDLPSFSEMSKRFPEARLQESYDSLRKEFNGYFQYDNEQISAKFKAASGDPVKEAAAAEYAARQWTDTQEHLDSRLLSLLQSETKLISPSQPPKTGLTQKSLETVDWSEIRRNLQATDPKEVQFNLGADIHKVEDLIEGLLLKPEKSPNSIPKADQPTFERLLKLGREQLVERGQSTGLFLPAPTEFRQKNLGGRTVEEFSDYILKAAPEEWKAATENMTGGLTGGAWNLGLGLKDAGDVSILKSFQDKLSDATKAAMQSGDFDSAYSLVSKGQFFREAYEAATGTGSAGAAFKRGQMGTEGVKPPFPEEKNQASFLPKTKAGEALEKQGFEVKPFGQVGVRGVEIFDNKKNVVGEIISSQVNPGEANIANVLVKRPSRGKGIGEALYRELGAQLKEDGVTKVTGDVVAPEPLNIRRKVFGEFSDLKVNGKEAPFEDAAAAARIVQKGIEVHHIEPTNRITTESQFLPAEELAVGTAETQPDLKIVPAAAGAGTPPKPPSQFRPPPVAAGTTAGFLPSDEELDKRFPVAKDTVDGRAIREAIPNQSSVGSSFNDYEYLPGVRDVPMSEFPGLSGTHYSVSGTKKIERLAAEIEASKELNPLIVAVDKEGPYILEGANRAEALKKLGAKSFPALVVKDLDSPGAFNPRTESGRKLEERGFEIVPSGELGIRKVTIKDKDGAEIAQIQAVNRSPERAEILFVNKLKEAPKGVGEVLYRELGAQLKADGITELTGTIVAPEPLSIRKKVFGDFKLIEMNGEPTSYNEALAASGRIKNRTEKEVAAIEPVNTISDATRFLPKAKRNEKGEPLTPDGLVDYEKLYKDLTAANKKRAVESDKELSISAKKTAKGPKTKETKLTGWILPSKEFVPLEASFHENYLAENSKDLNKRFGTSFSDTSSVEGRLDALNAGFVRIRFDNSGTAHVEVNASKWTRLKPTVKRLLQDSESKLSGLVISLLNDKALQVDSATVPRMHELSEPQRLEAIDEALDSLRATSP